MAYQESAAFKDLLRHFRLKARLSQEALAERAHLSVRAISDLERGAKQRPRPETLQKLALALNLASQDRGLLAAAAHRPSNPRMGVPPHSMESPTTPPPASNLPVQLTSFIGREREQAEVMAHLETHHLVTIAGVGGAGKTRLALQVAGELVTSYSDGVWQVELARLSDATLVPQAVAAVLGLREQPGRTLPITIAEHLRAKKVLLVLDNCEHLISACADLVTILLQSSPQLRVLATSREGLRVPGETIYRMPSLSLPNSDQAATPEQLLVFEAIQLFVERTRERRSDFVLTAANASVVAQICRRLDGIPLAIELAAARLGVLTVDGIAERLDDCFQLLTTGPRTVLPRHQTLRAAFDWSHDLLGEQEQVLLRRLSVFVGGWMLEAAEAICTGNLTSPPRFASTPTANSDAARSPPQAAQMGRLDPDDAGEEKSYPAEAVAQDETLDLLDGLVNKSLVLMQDVGQIARYQLLETVRQYGHERLEAAGEASRIRDRHLDWYLTLAAQAERGLTGAEQVIWLSMLEREHGNLRAALAWSLQEPKRCADGMELAARLLLFWEAHGHRTEARRWLEELLVHGASVPPRIRARTLQCAGALASSQGDYTRAVVLLEASLTLQCELNDKQGIAMVLQALGVIALYQGDYGRAIALFDESLALRRKIGDPWGLAASLGNLGQAAYVLGDYERALVLHDESLALRRQLGNKRDIAISLNELGSIAWSQRDLDRAAALHGESLDLRREIGDKGGIAASLANFGEVAIAQGDYVRAAALLEESLSLAHELGDKQVIANCLESLATVAMADGAPQRAANLFGAAEALRERIGLPLPPPVRADYSRSTTAVYAAMGEDAYSAAWSQGQALLLDQAVALALVPTSDARSGDESRVADSPIH